MNTRQLVRLVLGVVAVALGLVPFAIPPAAHAGQVTVTVGIAGAGRVQVVEGTLEDGGSYSCDRTANLDHRVVRTCPAIRNEEPFEAWVWLRPVMTGVPAGWEFVQWQGCDETRTNTIGTRDCAVHSGAFNSVEKYPVAVYRDVEAPVITAFGASQVENEQNFFQVTWSATGHVRNECQLDGAAWQACTSPWVLSLSSGGHDVAVRAVDASGNLSQTRTARMYSLDTRITGMPPKVANSRSADFVFTSEHSTAFDCTLDGKPIACADGRLQLKALSEGTHLVTVAGRNGTWVDPVPARWEWTVDTIAPDTTVLGGPAEGSTTTATSAEFTLVAPGAVFFACTIDHDPIPCQEGPVRLSGLTPGRHVFEASASDAAGNWYSPAAKRTWTVQAPDRSAPDTTLGGGPADGSIATAPDATFELGTTEPGARTSCTLDGVALPCAPGALGLTGLAPGTHVLSVTSTDANGNTDASPATRTWTVPAPASALKGKGWKLRSVAGSYAGKALTTKRKGATASYAVADARRLALVVTKGKKLGKVKVYAGKRLLRTVSLKGAAGTRQVVLVSTFAAPFTGKVRIVAATGGKAVQIEGIAAPTR